MSKTVVLIFNLTSENFSKKWHKKQENFTRRVGQVKLQFYVSTFAFLEEHDKNAFYLITAEVAPIYSSFN